jgi:DtxR family transcriptional regulator, Mn-dependent transcriptional regulator
MKNKTWKEFSKNELTHSGAHYLMAIQEIHLQQGYARLSDVAKRLNISKGSLSTSLKTLIKKGLILEDLNKHLSLSETGQKLAENIDNTHTIASQFFTEVLGVDPKTADVDACKIEHLLSLETSNKLLQLNKALRSNPQLAKDLKKNLANHQDCSIEDCKLCIHNHKCSDK